MAAKSDFPNAGDLRSPQERELPFPAAERSSSPSRKKTNSERYKERPSLQTLIASVKEIRTIDTDNDCAIILALRSGVVESVDYANIRVLTTAEDGSPAGVDIFRLHWYFRLEHRFYVPLLPLVKEGDAVAQGDALALASSIEHARATRNVIVGFNFQEALGLLSNGIPLAEERLKDRKASRQGVQGDPFLVELYSLRDKLLRAQKIWANSLLLPFELSEKLTIIENTLMSFFGEDLKGYRDSKSFSSPLVVDNLNSPLRSINTFQVVGEIEEERLAPSTIKTHLSLEIKALVQRHGYDAVSKEIAAHSPSPEAARAPTSQQAEAVLKNSTLGKLLRRYNELLRSVELPTAGFKTLEQARAAARLSSTYDSLVEEQVKLGFEPSLKDDRVTEARRLRADFYRKRQNALRPAPNPVGRPRKLSSPK